MSDTQPRWYVEKSGLTSEWMEFCSGNKKKSYIGNPKQIRSLQDGKS